jgi:hypothetical protein
LVQIPALRHGDYCSPPPTHSLPCLCLCRDYRRIDELDRLESEGLGSEPSEVLNEEEQIAARQAAEAQLDRRDRREGVRTGRALPAALAGASCQPQFQPRGQLCLISLCLHLEGEAWVHAACHAGLDSEGETDDDEMRQRRRRGSQDSGPSDVEPDEVRPGAGRWLLV